MNDHRTEQAETKAPKVSVLMAVYNGERYLREAIESILGQTFTDFEFIIVNDGSADSSRDIVLTYQDARIILIDNPENIGLTRSLNKGLALARGEYVARQDADDISHLTRFKKQIEYLDARPEIALLGTQAFNIDKTGKRQRYDSIMCKATSKLAIKWQLLFDSAFIHTSVMYRRSIVWELLGGYDIRFLRNQDMDLWLRIANKYEVANLSEVLVESRYTTHSVSRNYSMNDVQRVADALIIRIKDELMVDPLIASEWLAFWHQVTNPLLGTEPVYYMNALCNLNAIGDAFERRYPKVLSDKEYFVCLTSVYARAILFLAGINRISALKWYAKMIPINRFYSIRIMPKFCLLFLFGKHARTILKQIKKKF